MTVLFPSNLYFAFACVYFFLDLVDVGFKENRLEIKKARMQVFQISNRKLSCMLLISAKTCR